MEHPVTSPERTRRRHSGLPAVSGSDPPRPEPTCGAGISGHCLYKHKKGIPTGDARLIDRVLSKRE